MNTYKITNLSNLLGKRDLRYDTVLDIDYVDSMMKKTIKIKPGETIFLQISSLPLSVHRLRVKKLISVVEIGQTELQKHIDAAKPVAPKKVEVVDTETTTLLPTKKKSGKRGHDSEQSDAE